MAELILGFWANLFDKHYEVNFWTPHRKSVFPYAAPSDRIRREVHADIRQVRDLRNRISHHEPIWRDHSLLDAYYNAHKIITWISPAVAKWLSSLDQFPAEYDKLQYP